MVSFHLFSRAPATPRKPRSAEARRGGRLAALGVAATLALLAAAPGAAAQTGDLVEVVPISDVIVAFKKQIAKVQAGPAGLCRLTIARVVFRFRVASVSVDKLGVGGEGEVFGVKLGGKADSSRSRTAASIIEIAMVPPRGGLSEVSESGPPDFADLILHAKAQIELAAEAEPRLKVERVTIATDFILERESGENLSVVVLDGARKTTDAAAHRVTLTLTGQEDGPC